MTNAAEPFDFPGETAPGVRGTGRRVWGRSWWRLWILSLELVLLAGVTAVWHWPLLKVRKVLVDGPAAWEAQARSLVALPSDSNLFGLDPLATRARLAGTFGALADARVKLTLPDAISIRLTPTTPAMWSDADLAVAGDGALLSQPVDSPAVPIWRTAASIPRSRPLAEDAPYAAGAWNEVLSTDERYRDAVSELTRDPTFGWTMTAGDGLTRITFGRTELARRAATVATLLEANDTVVTSPCLIDARFDGLVLVRPRPKQSADSAAVIARADSLKADTSVIAVKKASKVSKAAAAPTAVKRKAGRAPAIPTSTRRNPVRGRAAMKGAA